jgi:hypothetical protein
MPIMWGNTLHLSLIHVQEFATYNKLCPKAAVQIVGFGIRPSATLQDKSLKMILIELSKPTFVLKNNKLSFLECMSRDA